jgi:hypothetical protein
MRYVLDEDKLSDSSLSRGRTHPCSVSGALHGCSDGDPRGVSASYAMHSRADGKLAGRRADRMAVTK